MRKSERRFVPAQELRAIRSEDGPTKIEGYAAMFDKLSENLGGFREKIRPGAFRSAIKSSDTRALFNHDPNFVLGRSKSGTLELSEDDKGLKISVTPPDTSWARDLMKSIERGDIDQMSFGFQLAKDGDEWDESGEIPTRTLNKISNLLDISPVTYPAYPDTEVAVRSMSEWEERRKEEVEEKPAEPVIEETSETAASSAEEDAVPTHEINNARRKRKLKLLKTKF